MSDEKNATGQQLEQTEKLEGEQLETDINVIGR